MKFNKYCFKFNSYDQIKNILNYSKEKNTVPILFCNYHLINDTPSISNESEIILSIPNTDIWFPKYIKFSEHRHDQSIFSLLAKKYNYNTGGILYGNRAIITRRNRTGVSQLK